MSVKSSHYPAHQEADGLVYAPFGKKYTYAHSDLDGSNQIVFPIPAGVTVLGVSHRVTTAFDNAADLDIGDSTDADGYLTQLMLTPTTLNNFAHSIGGAGAFGQGKYYAASDRLILAFTANPDAGEGEVTIFFDGKEA